jgi:hypothetical protein
LVCIYILFFLIIWRPFQKSLQNWLDDYTTFIHQYIMLT